MMLHEHELNSEWYGEPCGIVTDAAFFCLPLEEQRAQLSGYAWAEYKQPMTDEVPWLPLRDAGFCLVDTMIPFRIGLTRIPSSSSLEAFELRFADEHPFALEGPEVELFSRERFYVLPGLSAEKIRDRYVLWSNRVIEKHPETCIQVLLEGECQGWFLSEPTDKGLHLALAMSHVGAKSSGLYLYQAALRAYADRGARMGYAAFSATNTPVLNIYSQLGARFVGAKGNWLWLP